MTSTREEERDLLSERAEQSTTQTRWRHLSLSSVRKVAYITVGLLLFVFALQLAKEGAASATQIVQDRLHVTNAANALGFGWLFAYVVMSGSPVAAAGLALLAQGAIDSVQTFAMISGSRLGSSFMVLLLGFVYVLRGQERRSGLSIGLLSLVVTASLHAPALLLGYVLLRSEVLDGLQLEFATFDVINKSFDPLVSPIVDAIPGLGVFALGIVAIIAAFSLIDRGIPELNLDRRGFQDTSRLIYRPPVMFLLGFAITFVSLSVSVSLGILVPLSARGFIRRENLIPYIMGCNISTFIDTLVVAMLLQSSIGFTVVLVEMLSVAVMSIAILAIGYEYYERGIVGVVDWVLDDNRNFVMFLVAIFLIPIALMFV